MLPIKSRSVTDEERAILKAALSELQGSLACSAFGYWYGFSKELVSDVVATCHNLFTLNDIISSVIVYSKNHGVKILEILNEIFNDIDEHSSSGSSITFNEEFFLLDLKNCFFVIILSSKRIYLIQIPYQSEWYTPGILCNGYQIHKFLGFSSSLTNIHKTEGPIDITLKGAVKIMLYILALLALGFPLMPMDWLII